MPLGLRLLLVVLVAAAPIFAVQVYQELRQRETRREQTVLQLQHLAQGVAEKQNQFVAAARYLTAAAAALPAVRDGDAAACNLHMAAFKAQFPEIAGMGVAGPDGVTFCSSTPGAEPIYLADRDYFQAALREKRFAASGFIIGRRIGAASAIFVHPALDAQGEVAAVVVLAFSLESVSDALARTPLPEGARAELIDGTGRLVAGQAASLGEPAVPPELVEALAERRAGWLASGREDARRLYGFAALAPPVALHAVVGLPLEGAFAKGDEVFWRAIGLLAAIFLLAALAALVGGEWGIRRPLAALRETARRLARGDLAARPVRTGPTLSEIAALSDSLSAMADAVAARETELRENERRFRDVAEAASDWIWETDEEDRYTYVSSRIENVTGLPASYYLGKRRADLLAESTTSAERGALLDAIAAREPFRDVIYWFVRPNGRRRISTSGAPAFDESGRFRGYRGAAADVTEAHAAAERQKLLVSELEHRVKNTLATVISILAHSRAASASPEQFEQAVEGRVRALADAHGLLTARNWRGAELTELARVHLAPYAGAEGQGATLEGPSVLLAPNATLALGLALHELATNAAKHGALSVAGGRIKLSWRISQEVEPRLSLSWREVDGPPVAEPCRRGFGRTLIERGLAYELGGCVELRFAAEGVVCTIELPLPASGRGAVPLAMTA